MAGFSRSASDRPETRESLPFVIGVLGDFFGSPAESRPPLSERRFLQIDRDDFDGVLAALAPGLRLLVKNLVQNDGSDLALQLEFRKMEDFEPAGVARQVGPLKDLLLARERLRSRPLGAPEDRPPQDAAPRGDPEGGAFLLDQVIESTPQASMGDIEDLASEIIRQAGQGATTWDKESRLERERKIETLDRVISRQLGAVLHAEEFRRLEGAWRGLRYLVFNTETGSRLKIKVLASSKDELRKDLIGAQEADQSHLLKKIFDETFFAPGGEPFGVLIGDYEFTNHPDDMDLLAGISKVAATAFCPFIAAAAAPFFGLKGFAELEALKGLVRILDTAEYVKWKSFRESDESRFVVLTLPRVLARLPYGKDTTPVEEFSFEEIEAGGRRFGESFCWMSAAFVLGTRIADSLARTGWLTSFYGAQEGGLVEGLPFTNLMDHEGSAHLVGPVEAAVSDIHDVELGKLGFLPLCQLENTNLIAFLHATTAHAPKHYGDAAATADSVLSARLPCVLAISFFARHILAMGIEAMVRSGDIKGFQDAIHRWISQWISGGPEGDLETGAGSPLAEAKVDVAEVPGSDLCRIAISLRPRLREGELKRPLKLRFEIPRSFG